VNKDFQFNELRLQLQLKLELTLDECFSRQTPHSLTQLRPVCK